MDFGSTRTVLQFLLCVLLFSDTVAQTPILETSTGLIILYVIIGITSLLCLLCIIFIIVICCKSQKRRDRTSDKPSTVDKSLYKQKRSSQNSKPRPQGFWGPPNDQITTPDHFSNPAFRDASLSNSELTNSGALAHTNRSHTYSNESLNLDTKLFEKHSAARQLSVASTAAEDALLVDSSSANPTENPEITFSEERRQSRSHEETIIKTSTTPRPRPRSRSPSPSPQAVGLIAPPPSKEAGISPNEIRRHASEKAYSSNHQHFSGGKFLAPPNSSKSKSSSLPRYPKNKKLKNSEHQLEVFAQPSPRSQRSQNYMNYIATGNTPKATRNPKTHNLKSDKTASVTERISPQNNNTESMETTEFNIEKEFDEIDNILSDNMLSFI